MLLFGHTGLTLGAAQLLQNAGVNKSWTRRFPAALNSPDMRLVILGSMLPDIIDKPLGQYLMRETFNNGRIFSHTLLFLILVSLMAFFLYRRQGVWLIPIAFGTFTHLVFDRMWETPKTLFWPLYGFAFERVELSNWVGNMWQALLTNAQVYIPELAGMGILAYFAVKVMRRKMVIQFLKSGRLSASDELKPAG